MSRTTAAHDARVVVHATVTEPVARHVPPHVRTDTVADCRSVDVDTTDVLVVGPDADIPPTLSDTTTTPRIVSIGTVPHRAAVEHVPSDAGARTVTETIARATRRARYLTALTDCLTHDDDRRPVALERAHETRCTLTDRDFDHLFQTLF